MSKQKLKDLIWLFYINIFISSFTFGGGYVVVSMVRKYFVEKRKFFSEDELITMSAISQTTPGAIAINLTSLAGYKVAGKLGTTISCIGAIIPPIIILAFVSLWYQAFSTNHLIMAILKGMQAGIGAIIIDLLINMIKMITNQKSLLLNAMIPISFLASYIFKVNIMIIILFTAIIAIIQLRYQEVKEC